MRAPLPNVNRFKPMSKLRILFIAALAAAALAALAYQTQAWKRQYVGETTFSISLPGKLEEAGVTEVEDEEDWVVKSTDYAFESDRYYVLVTVFEGRKGTVANAGHLESVAKDIVSGLSEGEDGIKELGKKAGKVDEHPTLLQAVQLVKAEDKPVFKSFLLGDGNRVFALLTVSGAADTAAVDKIIASARFKAGLKD